MSTIGYYICVPFAWILRTFYELTGSYGWALVLFTLVVKLITLPFQMKSKKSMMRMNLFQPKMKEIQTKYANNPQVLSLAVARNGEYLVNANRTLQRDEEELLQVP